ncbi:MAG: DNA-binding transcriptional regulator [Pirellulales bacterium]|nr:DNA-binding transcriptional regulator [Pirellulales bacterium]
MALIIETSTSFGRRLIRGVAQYARENGPWSVYLEQRSIYDPAPPWLRTWKGDGIIAKAAYPELAKIVVDTRIPTVDLNEQVLGLGLPVIYNDNEAIGQLAAEHLLDRSFENFGFLGHPGIYWSDHRRKGFETAVQLSGCECDVYSSKQRALRRYRHESWEIEMTNMTRWVKGLPKPVGVMAANDFCAVQVLDACRRASVSVPEHMAVIGVDNESVAGELASPPLSSVVPNAERMGYEAAALLDQLMQGQVTDHDHSLIPPVGVVTRQSTDIMAITDSDVAEAVGFIRRHACDGINSHDVVRESAVSRSVLQRRFRVLLGRSIHDVIMAVRMERTKQLLSHTDLSLQAISDRVGISHVEYLSTVFKKHTKQTVTEYRQAHRLKGQKKGRRESGETRITFP